MEYQSFCCYNTFMNHVLMSRVGDASECSKKKKEKYIIPLHALRSY